MTDYGSSRRRARAGLVSMGYRQQGVYPITAYPIQGTSAIYANPSYGDPYQDKGWLLPLLTAAGASVSNHLLNQDKITANATAQKAALEIEALEAANRPYLYISVALVFSVAVMGVIGTRNRPKAQSKPKGQV
jgi:hypothetical protein